MPPLLVGPKARDKANECTLKPKCTYQPDHIQPSPDVDVRSVLVNGKQTSQNDFGPKSQCCSSGLYEEGTETGPEKSFRKLFSTNLLKK